MLAARAGLLARVGLLARPGRTSGIRRTRRSWWSCRTAGAAAWGGFAAGDLGDAAWLAKPGRSAGAPAGSGVVGNLGTIAGLGAFGGAVQPHGPRHRRHRGLTVASAHRRGERARVPLWAGMARRWGGSA